MRVRSVVFASVCSALLAASAAASGASAAQSTPAIAKTTTAYQALASGQLRPAIAGYSEAIESRTLPPEHLANALLNRALAYQRLMQHRDAIDDYTAALRVDALSSDIRAVALYNRGLSHQKIGKAPQAIEDFTSALFLKVHFPQAYYSRGNVLRRSGQYLFALSDYEKALKYKHPQPHLAYYGEALTYQALKRDRDARQALVKALSIKPDYKPARTRLSQMLGGTPQKAAAATGTGFVHVQPTSANSSHNAKLATGSLVDGTADLNIRKTGLPTPVQPPKQIAALAAPYVPAVGTSTPAQVPTPKVAEPVVTAKVPEPKIAVTEPITVLPAKTEQPRFDGWAVQITAQRSEESAWEIWSKLKKRHGGVLRKRKAHVQRADLGKRGIYYRLRVVELNNKNTAKRLCSRLKRRGTSCFATPAS